MQPKPAGWPDDVTVTSPRARVQWDMPAVDPATGDAVVHVEVTTEHVAPSVQASPGLLICAWQSGFASDVESYTLPVGMSGGAETLGAFATLVDAAEPLITAGETGTRTAVYGDENTYAALSIVVRGDGVVGVEEHLSDFEVGEPITLETGAGTAAGWWLIAVQGWDWDPNDEMTEPPSGGRWVPVADSELAADSDSRVRAWARRVEEPGPQSVTFPVGSSTDDHHARLWVLSGVRDVQPSPGVSGVSVERAITSEWPDQIAGVTGPGIATADVTATRPAPVSGRPLSPWGVDGEPDLPEPGTAVTLDVGYGSALVRKFTGAVYRARGSARSESAAVTCDDAAQQLRVPVTIDPIGSVKPPLISASQVRHVRLTPLWLMDLIARHGDFSATIPPPPGQFAAAAGRPQQAPLHVPMQGGLEALPGAGESRTVPVALDGSPPVGYEPAPWGYGVWPDQARTWTYTTQTAIGWAGGAHSWWLQAHLDDGHNGSVTVRWPGGQTLTLRSQNGTLQAEANGTVVTTVVNFGSGPCRAVFTHTNIDQPQTIYLQAPDGRSAQGTLTYSRGSGNIDFIETTGRLAGVSAQRSVGTSAPTTHVGDWEPTFLPDLSLTRLIGVPWVDGEDGWDLLAEIVQAEAGGVWCDEHGRLIFQNRVSVNDPARPLDGTVTSRDSIIDLQWEISRDWTYRYVRVPWQPVVNRSARQIPGNGFAEWVIAHAPTSARRYDLSDLAGLGSEGDTWFVDLDGDVIDLDTNITRLGCNTPDTAGSYVYVGDSSQNDPSSWPTCEDPGVGGRPERNPGGQASAVNGPDVSLVSPRRARLTISRSGSPTLADSITLAGRGGVGPPGPVLCARQVIVLDDAAEVTIDTAGAPHAYGEWLDLPHTRWRQIQDDAEELAEWFAAQVTKARPLVRTLDVVPDPRIQLGDHIELLDPDITGVSLQAVVVGDRLTRAKDGSLTQALTVRPLLLASGMVVASSGDHARTPDHDTLDVTGDLDIRADITPDDWDTSAYVVSKYTLTGDQRSYALRLRTGGTIGLNWSTNGSGFTDRVSTEPVTPGPDGRLAIRATLQVDVGGDHVVRFYTAPSMEGDPDEVEWAQLGGAHTISGTTSVFASTSTVTVGARNDATNTTLGVIHSAQVRDGINGTIVAHPRFDAQAPATAAFTDDAGRPWTLQGGAHLA